MLDSCEKLILRKIPVLPIEQFLAPVLSRNAIISQHLVIKFSINPLSTGHLWKVENGSKFQIFSSKSAHGCLQENCSLKRSGRNWRIFTKFC